MNETICATATAPGGALGIIRVSGPAALSAVSSLCSVCCERVATHTTHFTRLTDGSDILDEAMVTVFRAPHSYTGEDSVEISCHGSPYILQRVLALLCQHGCRMAQPGEYTMRAYLNGKMDLSQAEAVADLIASSNRATHHLAMSQLRGGIATELSKLREKLLKLTTLLELELDFSDHEDLEFANRSELLSLAQQIDAHISRLAHTFDTGQALKEGIPVAIIGAPNVGKSTLLNALLNEERAIVSDIQGTTRDTVEDTITLGGILFRFIDTAGIRHTADQIEQMGIERSLAAARRARIIIIMTEPGVPYPTLEVRDDQTVIHAVNKTDKGITEADSSLFTLHSSLEKDSSLFTLHSSLEKNSSLFTLHSSLLRISAKYGIGIEALKQQLIAAIPTVPDTDVIITNARHYQTLCRARQALQRVIEGLTTGQSADFLSEDLRDVLNILAEITGGQITPQETLNNIFHHFCVGK